MICEIPQIYFFCLAEFRITATWQLRNHLNNEEAIVREMEQAIKDYWMEVTRRKYHSTIILWLDSVLKIFLLIGILIEMVISSNQRSCKVNGIFKSTLSTIVTLPGDSIASRNLRNYGLVIFTEEILNKKLQFFVQGVLYSFW